MANTFVGVGILWGFPGGPTGTLSGSTTLSQIQALDFSRKAEKEKVKDGSGNTAAVAYTDHEDSATVDFIFSTSSMTGSATLTGVPDSGALITITDSNMTPMGKVWICDDFSLSRGNTKAMMAKVSLYRPLNNAGTSGLPAA